MTVGCLRTEEEKRNVATSKGRRMCPDASWRKSQMARSVGAPGPMSWASTPIHATSYLARDLAHDCEYSRLR